MRQREIAEQIKELYDMEISPELVTKITEKIMPEITVWQNRPVEAIYPNSRLQRCIVHQICSSSWRDIKLVTTDLYLCHSGGSRREPALVRGEVAKAILFERLLIKLDTIFEPLTESLAHIIQISGTDFSRYAKEEGAVMAANLSLTKAIKALLDTPILNEEDNPTSEPEALIASIQSVINARVTA